MITVTINLTDVNDEEYVENLLNEFQKVKDDLNCVMDFEQVNNVSIVICYYSDIPFDHDAVEYELRSICDRHAITSIDCDYLDFLDAEG